MLEIKLLKVNNGLNKNTELINQFINSSNFSINTKKAYRIDLYKLINYSNKDFETYTSVSDCIGFKMYLEDLNLSNSSICRILITVKSFYTWLNKIDKNINNKIWDCIKLPQINNIKDKSLSDREIEEIFKELENISFKERNIAIFNLLLNGLRVSEVINIKLEDINFEEKVLEIKKAKHNSIGMVPLFQTTIDAINNYLEYRDSKTLNKDDYLFVGHGVKSRNNKITYETIKGIVRIIRYKTQINFTAHSFRHTFATNLVLDDFNPQHAQTIMRHKNEKDFNRYINAAKQKSAIKAFKDKYI